MTDVDAITSMPRQGLSAARRAAPLCSAGRLVGIAGTLLVHALMFQVATLGSVAAKRRAPEETGPGASHVLTGEAPALTVMFIHLPGVSEPDRIEPLASVGVTDANAAIQIVSANPELAIDELLIDSNAEEEMTAGDPSARSQAFGQYTGQLAARIDRAWLKPRASVESARGHALDQDDAGVSAPRNVFRCVARITQNTRGEIQEIELAECNGSALWQQSLVSAIQRASPLPTPSDPSVFTSVLVMSFEAPEYRSGMSDRGYQLPPAQATAQALR